MKTNKIKNLIFAAVVILILSVSGCGNNYETTLREKIIPDFENVISKADYNFALYSETTDAAEAYIKNPSDETKAFFMETEEKNSQEILNNSVVTSALDGSEDSAMDKYGISKEDYNALFDTFEVFTQDLADWSGMKQFIETGDVESAEATLTALNVSYNFSQKFYYYGAMDMFADSGDENIEYVKTILKKYPNIMIDNVEWLTDHNKITEKMEEAEDEYAAAIDEYKRFLNQQENALLDEQKAIDESTTE